MKTEADEQLCKLFGRNLAKIRKEKGWSQEQLANESELARSYVSDTERGIRNVSLLNICKLAKTLNIEPHKLLIF
jgi:transcriptional regulator with XRE-family HTH domain